MKEEIRIMLIKYGVILGILCSSVVVSLSAHGMEKGLDGKGNIKGMGEQILCLKEDFIY